jgi:hypothetical protein
VCPELDDFASHETRKIKRLAVRPVAPGCQFLPVGTVGDQSRVSLSAVEEACQEGRHPPLFRLGGGCERSRDGYGSSFDADIGTPPDSATIVSVPRLAT